MTLWQDVHSQRIFLISKEATNNSCDCCFTSADDLIFIMCRFRYLSVAVYVFLTMLIGHYGGKQEMLSHLAEEEINPQVPPCCCCCKCLPRYPVRKYVSHSSCRRQLIFPQSWYCKIRNCLFSGNTW